MKIKVLEILGKDSYLIKDSELSSNIDFYVNREIIPLEIKRRGLKINKKDVLEYLPTTKELLGYERDKEFLTVDEYKSKPQTYYEGSSEESVLRAIANRKELEGFEPKYKDIDFEKVEIEIYGNVKETNSDFILCGITGRWDKEPVVYTLNVNAVTVDEYKKLKDEHYTHATFEDLDRTYLRFAKINNSYSFDDIYPFCEIRNEKIFNSLELATAEESKVRDMVRKRALKSIFPKSLNDSKKIVILSQLKAIKKAKTKPVMDEMLQILINDLQDYQKQSTLTQPSNILGK